MGSAENRTAFVKTVTDFAKKYDLDGLNFEYVPKRHNTVDPSLIIIILIFPVGNILLKQASDAIPRT